MTMARLVGAEILLIVSGGAVICAALVLVVNFYAHDLVRALFIR
jgi:hypothetical protein